MMKCMVFTAFLLIILGLCTGLYLYVAGIFDVLEPNTAKKVTIPALCFVIIASHFLMIRYKGKCCKCMILMLHLLMLITSAYTVIFGFLDSSIHLCHDIKDLCVPLSKDNCGAIEETGNYSSLLYMTSIFLLLMISVLFT